MPANVYLGTLGSNAWARRLAATSYPRFIAVGTFVTCLVTLLFFFPNAKRWHAVTAPLAFNLADPEVNRAALVLRQVADPLMSIEDPSNLVIRWRLLFPWIGHYLSLPPVLFLALPFIGCLAETALIIHLMAKSFGDRFAAVLAAMITCSSAWFFVSTGWLSYNDSWTVLALTVVMGVRSRWAVLLPCLLAPWIEDRFLVALPVALMMRTYWQADEASWLRRAVSDVVWAAIGIGPYVAVRLTAYLRGDDPVSDPYVQMWMRDSYPLARYLLGIWAGLRGNWILVAAFTLVAWRYRPFLWTLLALVVTASSIGFAAIIAGDLHRSMALFIPVSMTGLMLAYRRYPQSAKIWLPAIAAFQLLYPAAHFMTGSDSQILGYIHEWHPLLAATLVWILLSSQFAHPTPEQGSFSAESHHLADFHQLATTIRDHGARYLSYGFAACAFLLAARYVVFMMRSSTQGYEQLHEWSLALVPWGGVLLIVGIVVAVMFPRILSVLWEPWIRTCFCCFGLPLAMIAVIAAVGLTHPADTYRNASVAIALSFLLAATSAAASAKNGRLRRR